MAWERRARGSRYYTRSRKIGGRVVREYVGGGLVGALAAAQDAERRNAANQQAQAWVELRARLRAARDVTERFSGDLETLARGTLTLAGYHQHHRGEWRKARGRGVETGDGQREDQPAAPTSPGRRHGGDPGPAAHLNESPERWSALGNLAAQARRSWIELAGGNNEVTTEALGGTSTT